MPATALATLDVTLDAGASIVEARLAPRGGPHAQRRAVQRACLVLCATAWESYSKDSVLWLAEVAVLRCRNRTQLTPILRTLLDEAPVSLRTALTTGRGKPPRADDPRRAEKQAARARFDTEDKALLERVDDKAKQIPWAELLDIDLRRRVLGVRQLTGGVTGGMGGAKLHRVAALQRQTYGEALIEQVRLPGHRSDYLEWIDTLVEVRNAGVHRGDTPGPLDTTGVRSWIGFVRDVAHALDRLLEDWAEKNLPAERAR